MRDIVPPFAEAVLLRTSSTQPPSKTLPPGYIHLGVSKKIVLVVREFGLDPAPLIRAAGLVPRLFEDSTNVVPFRALARLHALCVARTNCPHFGLLVGRRATIQSMDLVGRLMQHSETVGDALEGLVSNLSVQDRAVVASLTVGDGMAVLSYAIYQPQIESAEQVTEAALAVTVNVLRALCGSGWYPTEVLVPRRTPAATLPYRRHFGAPARFGQESAALVFPTEDLRVPIRWGGRFHGFKDMDRSHLELVPP